MEQKTPEISVVSAKAQGRHTQTDCGPRLHRYMDTEQRIHPGDMAAAVKEALVRSEAK